MNLFGLLGLILVIVGVLWMISGSLFAGLILIVVGLFLAGGTGYRLRL